MRGRLEAELAGDAGAGETTVVYLPGIDGTGEFLLATAARLAERFRLIRLRYRHVAAPYTQEPYAGLAQSVLARLDELDRERVVLLSESFGGAVALRLALDAPQRVNAVCLVNSFARFEPHWKIALAARLGSLVPDFAFRAVRRRFVEFGLLRPRRAPDVAKALLAIDSHFDAGYRIRLAMIRALDLLPELSQLEVPLTLFAADHDRVVRSLPAARAIAARVPHARIERLEGYGHMALGFDDAWPDRIAAALVE